MEKLETKKFEELTREELASLTEENILGYIKLALAEAGVPLEEHKPRLITPKWRKSLTIYSVAGRHFKDREVAKRVKEILEEEVHVEGWDQERRARETQSWDHLTIEEEKVMTPEEWSSQSQEILNFRKTEKAHREALDAFNANEEARGEIIGEIRNTIWAAKEELKQRAWARKTYKEYLSLANDDPEVARKFFIKAYPGSKELLKEVLAGK